MQSIEVQVEHELAKRNIREESISCVSSTTENMDTSTSVIRFHRRSSVIRYPCKFAIIAKKIQDKLSNEIALTYKQFIQTEDENKTLRRQTENLDRLVKQQDYQLACLSEIDKTVDEMTHDQNDVTKVVQAEVDQIPTSTVNINGAAQVGPGSQSEVSHHHSYHSADREKEPEIYCVCGVKFTTKQNLREHIKYNTFRTNFSCNVCGIWKHGLNQLRTHMKVTHGISSAYLTSLKGCRLCGKLFTSLAQIHEHRRTQYGHLRKREYKNVDNQEKLCFTVPHIFFRLGCRTD